MFSNIEYGSIVAAERFRSIREDFLRTRAARGERNHSLCALAGHTGVILIRLGVRLKRYGRAGAPLAQTPSRA